MTHQRHRSREDPAVTQDQFEDIRIDVVVHRGRDREAKPIGRELAHADLEGVALRVAALGDEERPDVGVQIARHQAPVAARSRWRPAISASIRMADGVAFRAVARSEWAT